MEITYNKSPKLPLKQKAELVSDSFKLSAPELKKNQSLAGVEVTIVVAEAPAAPVYALFELKTEDGRVLAYWDDELKPHQSITLPVFGPVPKENLVLAWKVDVDAEVGSVTAQADYIIETKPEERGSTKPGPGLPSPTTLSIPRPMKSVTGKKLRDFIKRKPGTGGEEPGGGEPGGGGELGGGGKTGGGVGGFEFGGKEGSEGL